VTLGEGFTPLLTARGPWGKAYLKADYMMPTGSYKDRGTTVMLTQLCQWDIHELIEDSSGNAGASVAAYSAVANIAANIFIPSYTSAGKAAQIALYGAKLTKVEGSREDTTKAAEAVAEQIFYASHNWSPWFVHGVKTLAYEIWEQLGWKAPSSVIVPVGNGSLVLGLAQGFTDLMAAREIKHLPKIYAVQTAACDPLAKAFAQGLDQPVLVHKSKTMAEGIASALPIKGDAVLRAVRASGGRIITVEEEAILQGVKGLAAAGFYVEPTSGVVAAGLAKLRRLGVIAADEIPVMELTGSGLKATDKLVELFHI
ncbi:MAG TPA: pyridoxal-phosphate dependent enzyme, partial [Bacillota bacterium]|nr:pyridoxal-phosphate dependent enzyme [Bacillota bacterium]